MPYLGNTPSTSFATVVKDSFSGDGSTVAFTLSKVATTNSVSVFVENVRQEPTTAYAVSGTTLTFTAAPVTSSGNNIYVLHMNPTTTTTHPAAQNLTAVNGTLTGTLAVTGTSTLTGNVTASADVSVGDDLSLASDGAVLGFGADNEITLTHVHNSGLRFEDNDKLIFGADGDFEIYHDSSNLYCTNSTGILTLRAADVRIKNVAGNETMAQFDDDGAVNLYYDNTLALSTASAGAVTVANGLTLSDGNLVVASGHGIDFSAASNDSEMTSEVLDDYEEGLATMAFSPGAGSITISTSYEKLSYTKIGRMVQMNGQLGASAISSLGTGNYLQITGLPFAAENLDDRAGRLGFHVPHDAANMVDGREIFGYINEGGAVINIYEQNSSGASNKAEMIGSNTSLYFTFTYNTAS